MHMYSITVKDYFQAAGPGSARIPSGGPSVAVKFCETCMGVKFLLTWGIKPVGQGEKVKGVIGSANCVSTVVFIKIQDPPAGVRFVSESE